MIEEYTTERIPIKSWCSNIDDKALEQAKNAANHPCTVGHIALMPDCHCGYGVPIGSVIATKNSVIPNAVGVDIGCGMIFGQLEIKNLTENQIKLILGEIREKVPTGFSYRKDNPLIWTPSDHYSNVPYLQNLIEEFKNKLCSLGGGNHFIELQRNEQGNICIMIHCGSRGLGYKVADYYHKKALEFCDENNISIPDDELAYLPDKHSDYHDYLVSMDCCLEFARLNRDAMFHQVIMAIERFIGKIDPPSMIVRSTHNYAQSEWHDEKFLMVHRKGAITAYDDGFGIIPGSMGTPSYIIIGKQNKESFNSCSHGAGRIMGRNEFNKTHTEEECNKAMDGIVFGRWNKNRKGQFDLSESPQAYKNIDEVMDNQKDLVEIVHKLTPLGVVKG